MKRIRKLSRKCGVTLVELIMTIVVVGIISIPLALLLKQHVQSAFQSQDYSSAVNLARFEMERVKKMSYNNIVTASFSNYQGYAYDVIRTVSYAQGNAASAESMKQVQVDVRKTGSATNLVSLSTYITRNVLYGI